MNRTVQNVVRRHGCCECGTYECQVPMAVRGRRIDIDVCIADIVAALVAANIMPVASCCGHGKRAGDIMLEDGRTLTIKMPKGIEGKSCQQ